MLIILKQFFEVLPYFFSNSKQSRHQKQNNVHFAIILQASCPRILNLFQIQLTICLNNSNMNPIKLILIILIALTCNCQMLKVGQYIDINQYSCQIQSDYVNHGWITNIGQHYYQLSYSMRLYIFKCTSNHTGFRINDIIAAVGHQRSSNEFFAASLAYLGHYNR